MKKYRDRKTRNYKLAIGNLKNGHIIYIMRQKEAALCFYMVGTHVLHNESAVFFLIMVYNTGAIFV